MSRLVSTISQRRNQLFDNSANSTSTVRLEPAPEVSIQFLDTNLEVISLSVDVSNTFHNERKVRMDPPYFSLLHSSFRSKANPADDKELWSQLKNREKCPICESRMDIEGQRAVFICRHCGNTEPFLEATVGAVGHGEEFDFSSFSYQRLSHFNDRLMHAQSKEKLVVPGYVVDKVMDVLEKQGLRKSEDITLEHTRTALRSLRLRNFYRHNTQVWTKVTGRKPLRFSPKQEEELRLMFKAIQAPFEKHRPAHRSNFLSYSFVLNKSSELLGYLEFLVCFPLLKGPDKLKAQDLTWREICGDLEWKFIPSFKEPPLTNRNRNRNRNRQGKNKKRKRLT